ncbi:MAG: DUF3021 domain-containing protein [Lachnospiraceae bacterium]|nr:DUF3021 domain-containing protein [Lachnospiraceae bacterium]
MKKKLLQRVISGLPIGIAIGYLITIFLSCVWGQGYYSPCMPQLTSMMGSEIQAVILQTALCALLGATFGGASLIWELDRLSIAGQTGLYFLIVSAVMMPVAYFTYWMDHSLQGFLGYFCIFAFLFILVWLMRYLINRHTIAKINARLK